MAWPEVWSVQHGLPPLLDLRAWGGALGVLGIALLLGLALLPRLRAWRLGDRILLRLLAGLVAAAPLTLAVGQIRGALAAMPWVIPAAAGWAALLAMAVYDRLRPVAANHADLFTPLPPPRPPLERWLARLGWLCVLASLLLRLAPAFCPPLGYDTLEYHMGIIPNVFELGRYRPIPHIFYSAQPQSTEALYTLAAFIEGTPWGFAPGALHWLFIVLVVILAARSLRLLGLPAAWRPWLILFFLEHPLLMRLQVERMSDWFGVLMMAGGLWTWLQGRRDPPHSRALRLAALMGIFIGGAVASKWTHAGTVAAPLLILAFYVGWDSWRVNGVPRSIRLRTALGALALAGGVGLLIWLPWGAWLWALRHNPFAPFMADRFPSPEWPAARLHFLLAVHEPLSPLQGRYWMNLLERMTVRFPGPPLIAMGLVGAGLLKLLHVAMRLAHAPEPLPRPLRMLTVRLAAGIVVALLLWGGLAQAADRFLGPLCLASLYIGALTLHAFVAALDARSPGRGPARWLSPAIALLFAALALQGAARNLMIYRDSGMLLPVAEHAAGELDRYGYFHSYYGEEVRIFRAANALPPAARILALNDARRYLYTGRIDTASVFDQSPIRPAVTGAASGEEIRRRLLAQGYTHVLYNGYEMVRLLRMQTPPALARDPRFQSILQMPDRRAADELLARAWWGNVEFAVDPLTPRERAAYGEFLATGQRRAVASIPVQGGPDAAPAFWLAPLR